MDTFFEYMKLGLWFWPILFFLMSALHFSGKITPSTFTGYSAKGQFMLGVAFTFCASSFLFQSSWLSVTLMLVYVVILFLALKVEMNAKNKLKGSKV